MAMQSTILIDSETVTHISINHGEASMGLDLEIDYQLYGKPIGSLVLEYPNTEAIRELADMINKVADEWEKRHL